MVGKGTPHKDSSDYHCGLNANTAWGDYTTARMVFWELGITVEVQKGEAILFLPRIMTHNIIDVQGGIRNVVDAFVHENVLIWKDWQHKKVIGHLRGGLRRKRRKLGLGRPSGESTSEGVGKAPEYAQDEETIDTEEEMETLYHKGLQEEEEEGEDQD
jgi:hypothetical protein